MSVTDGSVPGAGAASPSRMARALDRAQDDEVSAGRRLSTAAAGQAPAAPLDWAAFCAERFPARGRHDLEALVAYAAYRATASPRPAAGPSVGPLRLAEWESEGGATRAGDGAAQPDG